MARLILVGRSLVVALTITLTFLKFLRLIFLMVYNVVVCFMLMLGVVLWALTYQVLNCVCYLIIYLLMMVVNILNKFCKGIFIHIIRKLQDWIHAIQPRPSFMPLFMGQVIIDYQKSQGSLWEKLKRLKHNS